jgi:hypothetical protein
LLAATVCGTFPALLRVVSRKTTSVDRRDHFAAKICLRDRVVVTDSPRGSTVDHYTEVAVPHSIKPRPVLRGPTATGWKSPRRDEGLPFKTLLSMAAVQLSTGGLFLGMAWFSPPAPIRSWAGALILAVAIVQGKLVLKALKQRRVARGNPFRRTSFWRTSFVGVVLCYLASLALGPGAGTPYAFAAAVCAWYTLMLLPIAASPQVLEDWKRISEKGIPRQTGSIVVGGLLLMVATEVALRAYGWVDEQGWLGRTYAKREGACFATVGSCGLSDGSAVDELAGMSDESRFHVAIVASDAALGGTQNREAFAQLEMLTPGVRVTRFAWTHAGSLGDGNELARRVLACRPNLVLTFVCAGEDVLSQSVGCDWFDWRGTAIARTFVKGRVDDATGALRQDVTGRRLENGGDSLLEAGQELRVCRTPIDRSTERRWGKALRQLDGLVRDCRRSEIDIALVVAPSAFQVNSVLCETLCRRMGYDAKTIDVDLPQRRFATFASERGIGCVDLTPQLRLCDEAPYDRERGGWNDEGAAVAVHTLGGWLTSRYGGEMAMTGQVSRK